MRGRETTTYGELWRRQCHLGELRGAKATSSPHARPLADSLATASACVLREQLMRRGNSIVHNGSMGRALRNQTAIEDVVDALTESSSNRRLLAWAKAA